MFDFSRIRSAWVEINLDNLANNIREVKRLTKSGALVTAVIKADGYGHGAVKIGQTLLENGADRFAVAVVDEAIELRKAGFQVPILVLGYTDPARASEVIKYDLEQTVYSLDLARSLSEEAVREGTLVKIHIKLDTGMGRIGLQPNHQTIAMIKEINELPGIELEGIYTHFAVADEADKSYTLQQFEKFQWVLLQLETHNIKPRIRHTANSATIIDLPTMHLDMVRAGIMLYGLAPSHEVMLEDVNLLQVMSFKTRISHVKEIEKGDSVSYGRKFIANGKTKIASLPIGYADGFTRLLSGKAEALVHGKRVPLVGSICMDQCMIDVTGIADVHVGDEVVIFGPQGNEMIHIDELATSLGTINYEIVCMIMRRIPRVYTRNGVVVDYVNYLFDDSEKLETEDK